MPKNCPHRIRTRELDGCSDSYTFTGRYICVCESIVEMFGESCDNDDHVNCFLPAMTEAQRIKRLKDMGQQELDGFV